jgi:serine/threonine protein kinase
VRDWSPPPPRRKVIGHGASSTVLLEESPDGKEKYAIKQFYVDRFDPSQFIREVEILVKLNHPCVLRIFDYLLPQKSTTAEVRMEYAANGSLATVFDLVMRRSAPSFWNPTGISIVTCGIVLGMRFIHSRCFVHRDLKPSNILINEHGHTLIADFGCGIDENTDRTISTDGGTVFYAAPEQFVEDQATNKVDVFSFGLILCEILTGRQVFNEDFSIREVIQAITKGHMPPIPTKVLPAIKELISRCWSLNASDRPSFDHILLEFEKAQFRIVPDADCEAVREYVRGVRDWEQMRQYEESKSNCVEHPVACP